MINNFELVNKIIDAISDGYDDEENRADAESILMLELEKLSNDNVLKYTILSLCERIEDLEN